MFMPIRAACAALLAIGTLLVACQTGSTGRHIVRSASLDSLGKVFTYELGPAVPSSAPRPAPPQAARQTVKIDPLLAQAIQDSAGTWQRLIVSFRDTVHMPRFPEPDMTLDRDDPVNQVKRDSAKILIESIRAARAPHVAVDSMTVRSHGGRPQRVFWLTQSIVVEMPIDSVTALAGEPTVRYIELAAIPATPPHTSSVGGTLPTGPIEVEVGRGQINSDVYRSLGLDYGWAAILDTGVNTHALLMADGGLDASRVAERLDAVIDECCEDGDVVSDQEPGDGHGTSTMCILTGNDALGEAYEGVTSASVHSYRVYWYDGGSHVCVEGAELAIEDARAELDPVLVMEIDKELGAGSTLVDACNQAYTTGSSVISAVGNGTAGDHTPSAPGEAHRVLAVGAYRVNDDERPTYSLQRHGNTDDGRIKPDVMAPTASETGGIDGCADGETCEDLTSFDATSGATPYAAGAALLWRNWLGQYEAPVDPGLVYAFMIVSGRETDLAAERGAGPIRMPSDGWAWFGSIEVDPGTTQPIEIEIPWDDVFAIEAAIWWPEEEGGEHSYHELGILDPTDTSVETARNHETSVFQRATCGDPGDADGWRPSGGTSSVAAPLATGTWTVTVTRAAEPTYDQTVYYAIVARASDPPSSTLMAAALEDKDDGKKKGDGPFLGLTLVEWIMLLVAILLLGLLLRMLLWRIFRLLGSQT